MVKRANDLLESPLALLAGKVAWVVVAAFIGIALYAGRAKLHEEISLDPSVVTAVTKAMAAEHRSTAIDQLLTAHSADLSALHGADEKLELALSEIGKTVQHIDTTIATVSQRQEDGQREQRDNIRRIDTTLNAMARVKP